VGCRFRRANAAVAYGALQPDQVGLTKRWEANLWSRAWSRDRSASRTKATWRGCEDTSGSLLIEMGNFHEAARGLATTLAL